jgi:hypothetical protein
MKETPLKKTKKSYKKPLKYLSRYNSDILLVRKAIMLEKEREKVNKLSRK